MPFLVGLFVLFACVCCFGCVWFLVLHVRQAFFLTIVADVQMTDHASTLVRLCWKKKFDLMFDLQLRWKCQNLSEWQHARLFLGSTAPTAPAAGREPSLGASSELRQDEWAQAEERYGLFRPSPDETAIMVHRQTTQRWAVTPEGWDEIPVHHNMRPDPLAQ